MLHLKKLILTIYIILLGCTTINSSNIPFCQDINVTGINCHSPEDFMDNGKYNWSNAICKGWQYVGTDERMTYCFNALENATKEFENVINAYCKSKCCDADDCARNMSLDGCSYDGCNYCCNDECTLLRCEEEPVNISKLNFTWSPINQKPPNEKIPNDYIQITIYKTNCQCMDSIRWCEGWDCSCDDYYCYNQSKIIWVPRNNHISGG